MANVIRHKRGTSTPSASDFSNTGEILVDTNSGNIFNKTDGNSVVKVNGINDLVDDTSPQLGGNLDMQSNNISGTGTITANSVANDANGMRKITASTSSPSGGSDGDVWIKYTA